MTQHPTIRALSGASAPQSLDPCRTAVLAIDFQNEYFTGRMPIPDGEKALANAKRLIERADESGMKVYHVHGVVLEIGSIWIGQRADHVPGLPSKKGDPVSAGSNP
ncbi:isochorismatase family protein [Paracoccus sp. S3-43]|uniref:isochorismatase family protein n=1 Tax=Paracoccus sp. S3-43 TaxID=3030011 RepID=UPI0023B124E5|nr:isochorismatase family protein [Paracoccus sp. S3-43]WEF25809.1 isochorismatase family protein [Paracoccus sp. S3-43]